MEKPAGNNGIVQNINNQIICKDGTPLKFLGVNINSTLPYSDEEKVDQWVKTLSSFGVNCVRFHQFTYHGRLENFSTNLSNKK